MPLPPQRPGRPGAPSPVVELGRGRKREELAEEASKLEEEIEALRARYEQYFLGLERREPTRWREEARKKVLRLKAAFTRNAGLRFRIQSLHARYLSYERLWLRSAREKEEGTYRRDLFKARLHAREKEETERAATVREPAQAAAPPPPSPSTPPAGAGDEEARLRAVYDAYLAAKRQCNEDVSRLTFEALARTVAKQVPVLIEKYKARSVDFRVEVKDGKAVLKAIPRV
jgi:hypothetical protein